MTSNAKPKTCVGSGPTTFNYAGKNWGTRDCGPNQSVEVMPNKGCMSNLGGHSRARPLGWGGRENSIGAFPGIYIFKLCF